jgi:hypothetical protein
MIAPRTQYSAELFGYLEIGGSKLVLGQLGPEYLILRDPAAVPGGRGEIVMLVDGEESRLSVLLPSSTAPSDLKIPYRLLTPDS